MSNRDDLHAGDRLPKDDHERKPTQDDAACAKVMSRILLRIQAQDYSRQARFRQASKGCFEWIKSLLGRSSAPKIGPLPTTS